MPSHPVSLREGFGAKDLIYLLEEKTKKRYTQDQREAILYGNEPLWITAGPGSGKSEVIVARVVKLLVCDRIPPESIIVTTFTERSASNLSNRISSYLADLELNDGIDITGLRMGTLHSLCNAIMRDFRFPKYRDLELLDEDSRMFFLREQDDILDYFKKNWKDLGFLLYGAAISQQYGPSTWQAAKVAAEIFDRITEFRVDVQRMLTTGNTIANGIAEVYQKYRERLLQKYRCDFATLQDYFIEFLNCSQGTQFLNGDGIQHEPISHLLVDEFQDTNPIQEDIYFLMMRNRPHNLSVVGDDDQALYRFRGGTVDSLVNFDQRCIHDWGVEPHRVNLNENRRSHPEIVKWFNNYISCAPAMQRRGVRAPGKRLMLAKSNVNGKYPAVLAVWGRTNQEAADKLSEFIFELKRKKLISDWREIGVLLRSTRETAPNAGPFVEAFKKRGIPFYNPRNRSIHKDPRIQQLLGTLIVTLDNDLETLVTVNGRVRNVIDQWVAAYESLAQSSEGKGVKAYVKKSHATINGIDLGQTLNTTLMDVLYHIISLPPFTTIKEDPNYATRFAIISGLIDSFTAFTEKYGVLRGSGSETGRISYKFLTKFYRSFCGFIMEYGLNEMEDSEDLMPKGYVQIMTVHQAKGLEFPIVVVGSLNSKPRAGSDNLTEDYLSDWSRRRPLGTAEERAEQDLIRRFYVAYSRAKNLLVLCGKAGSGTEWSLGDWNGS